MPLFYNDWFGDVDASQDENLLKCFTQLPGHIDALHHKFFTIRAFKGSGKTAFLEQLRHCAVAHECDSAFCTFSEKFCQQFEKLIVIPIDVTKISFETITQFAQNKSDPRIEILASLSNIFKIIFIDGLVEWIDRQPVQSDEMVLLKRSLKWGDSRNKGGTILTELFKAVEKTFASATDFTDSVVNTFFNKSNIDEVYDLGISILRTSNINVLLVLDEFDIFLDLYRDKEKRAQFEQIIALSLLEIAYNGHSKSKRHEAFPNRYVNFKLLFPEDLYVLLNLRDKIKYDQHSIKLRWSARDLKEFMLKRIYQLVPKERWAKINPEELRFNSLFSKRVFNIFFEQHETTIDYIIRHTLFKPRDMQVICVAIIGEFITKRNIRSKDEFFKALPIDQDSIRSGVKEGTQRLIAHLTTEFDTFQLRRILGILKNKSNILRYHELYNLLSKENLEISDLSVTDIINRLWELGIVGLMKKGDKEIRETYRNFKVGGASGNYYVTLFSFSWRSDIELSTEDELVIAPMFFDYLDLKIDKGFLINTF